jgi:hypothetical protein
VKLNVLHKGQDKVVNLTLGQLPNTIEAKADIDKDSGKGASRGTDVPKLGMTVAPADSVAGAGKEGVVITEVDPKSAAAERGFKEGDVILEVGGKSVGTAGEVREAIDAARTVRVGEPHAPRRVDQHGDNGVGRGRAGRRDHRAHQAEHEPGERREAKGGQRMAPRRRQRHALARALRHPPGLRWQGILLRRPRKQRSDGRGEDAQVI